MRRDTEQDNLSVLSLHDRIMMYLTISWGERIISPLLRSLL